MKIFFLSLKLFIQNVAKDTRIPEHDKKILIGLISLIILLPILFLPIGTPLGGQIFVFFVIALVWDYFFETLDTTIVLSHYPWTMKSFSQLQRVAHFFAFFAPNFIRHNLWKYKREPF